MKRREKLKDVIILIKELKALEYADDYPLRIKALEEWLDEEIEFET
jgi:hypothetical protein